MSEELYDSNDYCKLAEEFEELKKENAELARDKVYLINASMDGGDKYHYEAHDIGYRDLERKVKALEADYVISNRELLVKQVEITALQAEIARLKNQVTDYLAVNAELVEKVESRDEKISELEAIVNPASFRKFLVEQIKDPELAEAYVKACIQDTTYKELLAHRDEELALTEKKLCNIDRSARAEVARRDEELKTTDGLLKEATETIGAVVACCTYNSNDDAKIGIYGIDQKAFTMIDQFITHYNDTVSAGKVSVDVKRDLSDAEIEELGAQEAERKEFCPNCEAETPCTHEAELFVCDICGEDFAKYIVSRNCNVSDVSMTQDVSIDVKTPSSIENTNPDYYKQELARRDEIIKKLKEDGERLVDIADMFGDDAIAVLKHRALMKELE